MSSPKKKRSIPNKGKRTGKSVQEKIPTVAKGKRPVTSKSKSGKDDGSIRLNKYIANSGVCTRRDADLYISSGNVWVNGKVITEMGYRVQLTDEVKFDGQIINPIKKSYIRNTSGLLLLSNDDSFLGVMNSSGRLRQIYHVELNKNFSRVDFDKVLEGVHIDGNVVKVHDLQYIEDSKKEIGIQINSQKNRIVTRIFERLGYTVERMDRVVFGELTKKDLPRGRWRELTKQELINIQMMS